MAERQLKEVEETDKMPKKNRGMTVKNFLEEQKENSKKSYGPRPKKSRRYGPQRSKGSRFGP